VAAVSIVVPCHNSARYLRETVESATAQTLADLEVVLVDDGSTDGTRSLAAELARSDGERVRLVCQDNRGVSAARNRGILEARGRYVLPLDADDLIDARMLEEAVAMLEASPAISIVYTDRADFGDVERTCPAGAFELPRLAYFNQIGYCSLFRRSLWEELGGYRGNVDGFDDWDFWLAAALRGHRAAHLPKPYHRHRRRADSLLWRLLPEYERLFARIVLNNSAAYSAAEVDQVRRFLDAGAPSSLLSASRFVFLARYYEGYPVRGAC
jgi:glycosyltransferase involved in cell wall biosynthesis